jgi:hypothetical protein
VVTSSRPVMPRCTIHCASGLLAGLVRAAAAGPFADNVFSGAMNAENRAAFKPLGLRAGGVLKGSRCAEPRLDNAVAAHPLVDAAGNRLHLRQFGHRLIVEETTCCVVAWSPGSRIRLASKLTIFHAPWAFRT